MTTNAPLPPQGAEQLQLLPTRDLPLQFRLDRRTRERGLAHVAQIKARLAASAETRAATSAAAPAARQRKRAA
jgi:hypothetical protein